MTDVPGQMDPEGDPDIETEGVAGASRERLPKLEPDTPVVMPATPVATDA